MLDEAGVMRFFNKHAQESDTEQTVALSRIFEEKVWWCVVNALIVQIASQLLSYESFFIQAGVILGADTEEMHSFNIVNRQGCFYLLDVSLTPDKPAHELLAIDNEDGYLIPEFKDPVISAKGLVKYSLN